MTFNLKEELEFTKSELKNAKNDIKLIEDKLEYCQNRLLDIRNDKDDIKKRLDRYEILDIDKKLEDADKLKNDYLKQKHRLEVTKELLDDSREEIILLKKIIDDFKDCSVFNFIRKNYPESINKHYIKYEKYGKYNNYKDKL
ncbi:hypothetical protein KQY27_01490 [Methanobrevibacter sp. TMH8]|uniref:hypothetical protein n=1 Tax=Methanobrevibacter sp. TMH8 TaxID=2848611 RepID=UPI001CCC6203|nr:hypothetical protein [Methanobrevibacter sp. TMH8]MBZ9570220.1 hypothetical protein [Methanobrevibacter sp. TMH8]